MNLEIFNNEEFGQVRTVLKDGEIWFVGKDVAEVLGYSNASKALSDHCKGGNEMLLPTNGGNQLIKIIPERDVYRLIMRSKLPSAEKFEEWVVGEVLPTIRKTSGYIQEDRAVDFVNNWLPSLDDVSKNAIASVLEENRKMLIKIKKDKPLVDFAESVSASSDSIEVGVFAKVINDEGINIGRNKMFEWLRSNGYLMKNNIPYQKYVSNNYFELIEYTYKTPFGEKIGTKTLITGNGQIRLLQSLKSEFGVNK